MEHFHSNLRQKLQHWWNSSIMLQFRNGRLLKGIGACFCFNMTSVFIGRVWNTSVLALGQVVSYEELNLEWNFSYVKCKIKSFPLPVASNYEKDCLVENLTLRIFVEMFDITPEVIMAGPRQALEKHRAIELNDSWLMELILITEFNSC